MNEERVIKEFPAGTVRRADGCLCRHAHRVIERDGVRVAQYESCWNNWNDGPTGTGCDDWCLAQCADIPTEPTPDHIPDAGKMVPSEAEKACWREAFMRAFINIEFSKPGAMQYADMVIEASKERGML
jgi:hypothetical protein